MMPFLNLIQQSNSGLLALERAEASDIDDLIP